MSNNQTEAYEEQQLELKEEIECHHVCTSNCRRVGCNCECGPWHGKEDN